jgi:hypothetical protein
VWSTPSAVGSSSVRGELGGRRRGSRRPRPRVHRRVDAEPVREPLDQFDEVGGGEDLGGKVRRHVVDWAGSVDDWGWWALMNICGVGVRKTSGGERAGRDRAAR